VPYELQCTGHTTDTLWGVDVAGHSVVLPEYAAMSIGRWFLGNGAVSEGEWFWDVVLCLRVSGSGMWCCALG
jgi:hypothetical protein